MGGLESSWNRKYCCWLIVYALPYLLYIDHDYMGSVPCGYICWVRHELILAISSHLRRSLDLWSTSQFVPAEWSLHPAWSRFPRCTLRWCLIVNTLFKHFVSWYYLILWLYVRFVFLFHIYYISGFVLKTGCDRSGIRAMLTVGRKPS